MLSVLIHGCKDPWDDHLKMNEGVVTSNLMEILRSDPELSTFTGYLVSAGWESELSSSKSFTVWAPTNTAMDLMDAEELEDTAKLALFVDNHICFAAYSYLNDQEPKTLKTYSGKNIVIDPQNGTVQNASLIEPYDILASNGILHKIDKPLTPKPHVWDIVETTELCPKHTGFLNSLSEIIFDPSEATVIGVDPETGQTIYDTLSGMVWSNWFVEYVRDLRDEDEPSTLFLIEDAVFDAEFSKFRKYYVLDDSIESDGLTYWYLCRDLVFPGRIEPEDMPDTLISLFGIKIPFNPSAVQHTYDASNGIVYVLSECEVGLQNKFPPLIIEGEDTLKIINRAISGQTGYTRKVELASGGYDFILDNHGGNPGSLVYNIGNVAATVYRFYWVAVNDFNGSYRNPHSDTLWQRLERAKFLGIQGGEIIWEVTPISSDWVPVVDTSYETAGEVPVGGLRFSRFQSLWLQVTGSGRNTTICLDYLKAVPVLE